MDGRRNRPRKVLTSNAQAVWRMRDRRERDGVCIYCGFNAPTGNGVLSCADCRAIQAAKKRALVAERRDSGVCIRCRVPVKSGGAMCATHIVAQHAAMVKYHAKKKGGEQ